jgi:predicted acyltransferase
MFSSAMPDSPSDPPKPARLLSLDAYRGAIMLFMASSGFGLAQVAGRFPDSALWKFLAFHTSHAPWVGGGAWDMIQPSFMFMVGVAMPYSYARRMAEGHSFFRLFGHALWRALVLVLLAVFLASKSGKSGTVWQFTNVLGQIGLGYAFLFLLLGRGWKVQLGALAAIAAGCWAWFAMHPLPPPDFAYTKVGVKAAEVGEATLPGFFAHWNKNANAASAFDVWFLNLFPTEKPFAFNPGGYATLNFIPSLITMILGLMTGEMLRRDALTPAARVGWMLKVGAVALVAGLLLGWIACPIVKRIWTPSWALYSGGIALWILAAFYSVIDLAGWRRWAWPLAIVGMNSIAIYLLDQLIAGWIASTLEIHLGRDIFAGPYGIVWKRCSVLFVLWAICWWMYRRRIFLRI